MTVSPQLQALAAADRLAIADLTVKRNQRFGMLALLASGGIAAYLVVAMPGQDGVDNLQSDEEFHTSSFRPPSFVRDADRHEAEPEPEVIEIAPPPVVPPPAAPVAADVVESQPLPLPVEEEFPDRFRSKLIALDQQTKEAASSDAGGSGSGSVVAGDDRASRYLNSAAGLADRSARARRIARIDAVIAEGTLIPGILETAINSDLPGQIRAITAEDVYSFDGRRLLIPTGTRLIGEYQSDITRGQKRIFVIWTRLIRNDGVTVRLNSIGSDSLGRSGLTGHVDNKFRERFGASIMLSVVGAGASYLTGYGSDSASSGSDEAERGQELARQTIARTFSDMANTVLSENLKIPPTINVPQGERIFVYVRQDLDFSSFYEDPVSEAMKEIRREQSAR